MAECSARPTRAPPGFLDPCKVSNRLRSKGKGRGAGPFTRSRFMSARFWFASFAIGVAVTLPLNRAALTPAVQAAAQDATTTTLDDQTELAVTVYNSDI